MTQTSWPFEDADTTETQFSQWARNIGEGVVADANGDTLEVTVGTGLAVDVDPGRALVRGHFYASTATESLSLTTADVSNDRVDTVVLRLDPTADSIVLAVVDGTPAGSPSAPTLTQTDAGVYELPLADVLVPAASGVPTTVTDRRDVFGTELGELLNVDLTTPSAGEKLVYDGTNWVNLEGYVYVDTIYYTSSDTFTKASYSWLRAIRVKVLGGGGGGGGSEATGAGEVAMGGNGGGAAYAESFITDIASLSSSETVTVGSGGSGGAAGSNSGTAGGTSSFGTLVSAEGGGQAAGASAASPPSIQGRDGGPGDTATGDFIVFGQGTLRLSLPAENGFATSGLGGASFLGFPERPNNTGSSIDGEAAPNNSGAGGTGGLATRGNETARAGGNGGSGIVIVELYA